MNTKEFNETIDAMCSNFNISRNELEQGAAIPNELPDEEQRPIGIWGQRHLRYLRQRRRIYYVNLLTTGRLPAYLAELNRQAQEMFTLLTEQYAAAEGVTEQLKAENQLEWVRRMNSIRDRVTEVIHRDLIYT